MRVAPQMVRSCCSPCASVSSSATRSGSWAPQAMRPHSSTHSSSSAGRLPPLMPPLVRQRSVGSSRRVRLPPTLPYRHLTATPFPAPHGTQSPCPASRPAVAWCRDHSPTTHLPNISPPWHTLTHISSPEPSLARRRSTFCGDSAHADNDHTANMIERFRAIGAPGACHAGGSTRPSYRSPRSECSDEESGELHDVFPTNHIVRPVSRRPPAPASAPLDGSV